MDHIALIKKLDKRGYFIRQEEGYFYVNKENNILKWYVNENGKVKFACLIRNNGERENITNFSLNVLKSILNLLELQC